MSDPAAPKLVATLLLPRYRPIAYFPRMNNPAVMAAPVQTSRQESGASGSAL